jgi:hypothetical protein
MKLYRPFTWEALVLVSFLFLSHCPSKAQNSGSTTNPPLVVVVAPDPTAFVGTSSGAFTLIRYGSTDKDLNVDVKLSGSASNGVDYVTIPNVITIPAGALATDVKVDPLVDQDNRGNKSVALTLQTNSNYRIDGRHAAEVKIVDDVFDFLPPTVVITSPTNTSVFDEPDYITITATATDPGVALRYVSFYANDDFLGRDTNSPYSLVWSNPPGGNFVLFARAVDQFGRSALSAPVTITVTDINPVVKITNPTNGANFLVHQDISLLAEVTDADPNATIASVSFYANSHLLGKATNAPYSLVWSNAPSGMFSLRAVAVDQTGDKGTSKAVVINVTPFPRKIVSRVSK